LEDKSGVGRTAVSLPQGGGAAMASSDSLTVDMSRGGGSYSVSIQAPPGRGGLNSDLRLNYSSTTGFGAAGLGWNLDTPRIFRRTDTGVPTYNDSEDVFSYQGEELVFCGNGQYRAKIEKNFMKIAYNGVSWEARDRMGRLYVFGEADSERLYNPANPSEVFAWLISRIEDTNGNVIKYSYRRDMRTITPSQGLSFQASQLYLDKIEYNPHGSGWLHKIQVTYDYSDPNGPAREDAQLSYKTGFPLYTGFRLARIDVFADISSEFTGRIRSYLVSYDEDPHTGFALLKKVTVEGYDDNGNMLSLPPVTFEYSSLDTSQASLCTLEGAPQIDFAQGDFELVDLTANGIPDIINTTPGNHTFWLNNNWREASALPQGHKHFAPGTPMASSPNISIMQPDAFLADVRGRMSADLLTGTAVVDSPSYNATHSDILALNLRWGNTSNFTNPPPFNFNDGNSRVVDVSGRGGMDVLRCENGYFRCWLNKPDGSYEDRGTSPAIPGLSFQNPEWTFADINGDGLSDIVHVQNGRIEYYLNKGAGCTQGALFQMTPILMENSQALAQSSMNWEPQRLMFMDINGDGLDDAVYIYADRLVYWINRGGWSWSGIHEIIFSENGFPVSLTTNRASIRKGDMLGTGMPGILWSANACPIRFMDITAGKKPLLLTGIDNGVGGKTTISYTSTARANGREWTTRIPFSVYVINEIQRLDTITAHIEKTKYRFYDGKYDKEKREFLGFGIVEEEKVGDEGTPDPSCETRITITKNHLGENSSQDPLLRAKERVLAGLPYWQAISGKDTSRPYRIAEWIYEPFVCRDFNTGADCFGANGLSQRDAAGNAIPEPVCSASEALELELFYDTAAANAYLDRTQSLGGNASISSNKATDNKVDIFGRNMSLLEASNIKISGSNVAGYENICSISATVAPAVFTNALVGALKIICKKCDMKTTVTAYAQKEASHIVLPVARILTRSNGKVIQDTRRYYDGNAYTGLARGLVDRGNLSREEVLILRQDQYLKVYSDLPGGTPDMAALGYIYMEYGERKRILFKPPIDIRVPKLPILEKFPPLDRKPVVFLPEGYGYFVNTRRLKYAVLGNGSIAYGNISGSLDAFGNETLFEWDAFHLSNVSKKDPAGNSTLTKLNYRVSKSAVTTDANGNSTYMEYDALGRLVKIIKPGDNTAFPTIKYEYHTSILPICMKTSLREEANLPGTHDYTEYMDGWGRQLQNRLEAENGTFTVSGCTAYNFRGGIMDKYVPYFDNYMDYSDVKRGAAFYKTKIDALDRKTAYVHPDGRRSVLKYKGFEVEEYDREDMFRASSHYATPTKMVYDTRGNLVEVYQRSDNSTIHTIYEYDILNLLTAIKPEGGPSGTPVINYMYDLLGRRLRAEHIHGGAVRAVFDVRGLKAFECNGLDNVVIQKFDKVGRIIEKSFSNSAEPPIQYTYIDSGTAFPRGTNLIGRLSCVRDALGTAEFTYNSRGHLTRHLRTWDEEGVKAEYRVDFRYDSADRLIRTIYPSLNGGKDRISVYSKHGTGNLLESIEYVCALQTNTLVKNIDYDARGMRKLVEFGSGLVTEFNYDENNLWLSGLKTHNPGNSVLQDLEYYHDLEGNLIARLDKCSDNADIYGYDALYRLVSFTEAQVSQLGTMPKDYTALLKKLSSLNTPALSYKYSPIGDILELGGIGAYKYAQASGTVSANFAAGGCEYIFDKAGRLSEKRSTSANPAVEDSYFYDCEGRLTRIEQFDNDQVIEITYDYEGERISKLVKELSTGKLISETRYIGRWVVLEHSAGQTSWSAFRLYVFDENKRIAELDAKGNIVEYIHADHLGSASAICDKSGNSLGVLRYKPFGEEMNSTVCSSFRYRYNGKETDNELGLVNFGARYYIPLVGRWASIDPAIYSEPEKLIKNPQGLNVYAYALNNPVTLVDPVGKSATKYKGEYIDTRQNIVRNIPMENGTVMAVTYRIVEAKPGTWLSKITYDFGLGKYYSKEQGYGAYDRNIIFPVNESASQKYNPDRIKPSEQFAVAVSARVLAPETLNFEGSTITAGMPKQFSKDWAFRTIVGGGLGITPVAGEAVTLEIKNLRAPGSTAMFTYAGAGIGVSAGVGSLCGLSDWTKFHTGDYLSLSDFEGRAMHGSIGLGYGTDEFVLFGPKNKGKTDSPVSLKSSGPGGYFGASATDGYLSK